LESQTDLGAAPEAPKPLEEIGTSPGARPGAGAGARASRPRLILARRPPSEARPTLWRTTIQWIVAGGIIVLLAWLTFALDGWIPVLSAFDLGVHEFGHLLTGWAPPFLCSLAGSFLQVAAPLGLAGYFCWRRDSFAMILMIAWAAENLNNVSIYIADAQVMVLPLFGDDGSGAGHDWHNILGGLGWLAATDQIANVVRTCSIILFVLALGLAVLGLYRARSA
jgi:hypothetical protein